ncbi:MAG: hypothetical protein FWD53_00825 [Phycisphaerales bacterium]|nr:hypothetical protein [Phycisphaerales bacterium]
MKLVGLYTLLVIVGFTMMTLAWHQSRPSQNELREPSATQSSTTSTEAGSHVGSARVGGLAFHVYLGGLLLLLTGGSGLLIHLYKYGLKHLTIPLLHGPLEAMQRHGKLLIASHVIYFGAVLVFMEIAYFFPDMQQIMQAAIRQEIGSGEGVLGLAGKAYLSKNIPLAAVVTVLLNFFLGSLAFITVPSVLLFGAGALLALWRAVLWGFMLAPTSAGLAQAMLPHSWVLLLEGEAYILAAFFGLMVPLFLFARKELSIWGRWRAALVLNMQAAVLVFLVLLVAGIYEAVSVILMMRH